MSDVAGADASTETAEETTTETASDPVAEQRQWMEEKFAGIEARLPEQQTAEPAGDFAEQFQQDPDDDDLSLDQINDMLAELEEDEPDEYGEQLSAEEQLAAYVQEQIQEHVGPLQQQLSERQHNDRLSEVNALTERYPDLKTDPAVQEAVIKKVQAIAARVGDDNLLTDADLVETVYKAHKAEAASASEVTAESAAMGDASLETGAGPSQQGDADPGDEYRQQLKKMATVSKDAF